MRTADLLAIYARMGKAPPADLAGAPVSKYMARRKEVNGITFASSLEAEVYRLLLLWEQAGSISDLRLQPRFTIMDAYVDSNGRKVRKREYVPDFLFVRGGKKVAVDAKGVRLPLFLLKSALFRARYKEIDLQEWTRKTLKSLA